MAYFYTALRFHNPVDIPEFRCNAIRILSFLLCPKVLLPCKRPTEIETSRTDDPMESPQMSMARPAYMYEYCSITNTPGRFPRINVLSLVFERSDAHPGLGLENDTRG